MSVARVILFLVVMGGLTLFVLQNASLSLSLVFLGMRSQTLPLSVWIVMSLAAGTFTSFLISGLVAFSNYLAEKEWRVRSDRSQPSDSFPENPSSGYRPPPSPKKPDLDPSVMGWQSRETEASYSPRTEYGTPSSYNVKTFQQEVYQPSSVNLNEGVPPVSSQSGDRNQGNVEFSSRTEEIEDDWVEGSSSFTQNDDWGDEAEQVPPSRKEDIAENPSNYEFRQEPKTQSWLGSVYSFGYREPQNTGVGKTESVYDANFRVITPPSIPTPQSNEAEKPRNNDDDDWGLGEDDELEDDRSSGWRRGDRT
ncbi:MAG TPA: hypothetical protein VK211_27565 [Kamptonema sp.]|nr:hypothetical protein [Kamptonema sp.]